MSCTCDGATSNRRLYHLLTNSQTDKHKVLNKYSKEKRYIYLICDPPHLIKTIRNCFASRPLWVSNYVYLKYICNSVQDIFIIDYVYIPKIFLVL